MLVFNLLNKVWSWSFPLPTVCLPFIFFSLSFSGKWASDDSNHELNWVANCRIAWVKLYCQTNHKEKKLFTYNLSYWNDIYNYVVYHIPLQSRTQSMPVPNRNTLSTRLIPLDHSQGLQILASLWRKMFLHWLGNLHKRRENFCQAL
jgi:hypothetical protein